MSRLDDAGNAVTADPTTVTTPEGRCKPEPSPAIGKIAYRFGSDAIRQLPLGHVPKVRPYWWAGYEPARDRDDFPEQSSPPSRLTGRASTVAGLQDALLS